MARKTKDLHVTAEGRDHGKLFRIEEMPAFAAEKWATRALLALSRSGVEIPEEAMAGGAATLIAAGVKALMGIGWTDAEPLLDEMMQCVSFVPSAGVAMPWPLFREQVEEFGTLMLLRAEVVEIHTGFSVTAALATLGAAGTARRPTTRTSRSSSGRRSPRS